MVFVATIVYENDTVLEKVYRLRHIARYIKRVKEGNPSISQIKSLPITPWLIDMVFNEASHAISIKCIEIQERTIYNET